jgi:hypothetical protein
MSIAETKRLTELEARVKALEALVQQLLDKKRKTLTLNG